MLPVEFEVCQNLEIYVFFLKAKISKYLMIYVKSYYVQVNQINLLG